MTQAQTPETLTEMLALLPDNESGQITAARLRQVVRGLWEAAEEAGEGGAGGESYSPRYKRALTLNPAESGARILRASFVTAHAAPDGADIRVFDSAGNFVPCYVYSVEDDAAGLRYSVSWQGVMVAGQALHYDVRYGDPLADFVRMSAAALGKLLYGSAHAEPFAGRLLSFGPDVAYRPADFETAGAQIFGNRDDVGNVLATPGAVDFAGEPYTEVYHAPNGSVQFGTVVTQAPVPGTEASQPNRLSWASGDMYEVWRRQVVLPDGFAWHIRTGFGGYAGGCDLTVRYQQGGIWTLSMLHNELAGEDTVAEKSIHIVVAGQTRRFRGAGIRRDQPGSALALRFGLRLEPVAVGAEQGL